LSKLNELQTHDQSFIDSVGSDESFKRISYQLNQIEPNRSTRFGSIDN